MTTPAVEAVLQTGATETRYHRAGAGAPLLLLFTGAMTDPLGQALFDRLARRFRVIAPVIPAGVGAGAPVPIATWLRDLIDGLGLVRPSVVADEALAGALLGFSLIDPGRIDRVVAVCRDHADPASSVGMLHAAHGLLVVSVDAASEAASCADEAVAEMVPFLDAGEHRA